MLKTAIDLYNTHHRFRTRRGKPAQGEPLMGVILKNYLVTEVLGLRCYHT